MSEGATEVISEFVSVQVKGYSVLSTWWDSGTDTDIMSDTQFLLETDTGAEFELEVASRLNDFKKEWEYSVVFIGANLSTEDKVKVYNTLYAYVQMRDCGGFLEWLEYETWNMQDLLEKSPLDLALEGRSFIQCMSEFLPEFDAIFQELQSNVTQSGLNWQAVPIGTREHDLREHFSFLKSKFESDMETKPDDILISHYSDTVSNLKAVFEESKKDICVRIVCESYDYKYVINIGQQINLLTASLDHLLQQFK